MKRKYLRFTFIAIALIIFNVFSMSNILSKKRPHSVTTDSTYTSITATGIIIIDTSSTHTKYYLDTNSTGSKDYVLSFGPSSYTPSSGATRPNAGESVTVTGYLFTKTDKTPLIYVMELNGLVWRDSIGIRFTHNPINSDSSKHDGKHHGNHLGWCNLDSLETVTYTGTVTIDSISTHHKVYYFDIDADNDSDYVLMFGPWWYKPTSGATRPVDGDVVTITGGLYERIGKTDTVDFLVVYQINGLQWIDTVGNFPWPGKTISKGHSSSIKVNSIYNSNTYCYFERNSFNSGTSSSSIYSSITDIDPVYLPIDNTSNVIAAYTVNTIDNDYTGLNLTLSKKATLSFSYNAQELSAAGVENKNLKLISIDDNSTATEITSAKFNYTTKTVSFSTTEPTGVYVIESEQRSITATQAETDPEKFTLEQNYPNPFNPSTNISFSLPTKSNVKLRIYSIIGCEIRVLANSEFESGNYTITWDGRNNFGNKVASGIYFYKLESDFGTVTRKMNLIK
jgi:hypothetical protein